MSDDGTLVPVQPVSVWWSTWVSGPWVPCPYLRATRVDFGCGGFAGAAALVGRKARQARAAESMEMRDALNGMTAQCIVRIGPVGGPYWHGTARRIVRRWRGASEQEIFVECQGLLGIFDQIAIAQGWDSAGKPLGFCPPFGPNNRTDSPIQPGMAQAPAYGHTGEGGGSPWTVADAVEHLVLLQAGVLDLPGVLDYSLGYDVDVDAIPALNVGYWDPAGQTVGAGLAQLLSRRRGLSFTVTYDGFFLVNCINLLAPGAAIELDSESVVDFQTSESDDGLNVAIVAGKPQVSSSVWLGWYGGDGSTGELVEGLGLEPGHLELRSPVDDWTSTTAKAAILDSLAFNAAPTARTDTRIDVSLLTAIPTGKVRVASSDLSQFVDLSGYVSVQPQPRVFGGAGVLLKPANGTTWEAITGLVRGGRVLQVECKLSLGLPAVAASAAPTEQWRRAAPTTRWVSAPESDRTACAAIATAERVDLQDGASWRYPGLIGLPVQAGQVAAGINYDGQPAVSGTVLVERVTWILEPLTSLSTIVSCSPIGSEVVR